MSPFGEKGAASAAAEQAKKEALWKSIQEKHGLKFEITDDLGEAEDIVEELLTSGEKPLITIPEEWVEKISEEGIPLIPKADLKKGGGYSVTAARLGADPYFLKGEERFVAEIDPEGLEVKPRLTGDIKGFYGTVYFPRGIPKEKIKLLGKFSEESWNREEEEKAA